MVTNRRGRDTMKRREVKTKVKSLKSLKQTYHEYHQAFRAFLAYRRKKIEEINLKKELKRAKKVQAQKEILSIDDVNLLLMDFYDGAQLFKSGTDL